MSTKRVVVDVNDLREEIYVRQQLDAGWVTELGCLLLDGRQFHDPIVVNKEFVVLDGRHRLAACREAGLEKVEVEIRDISDPVEMLAFAYKANLGGKLPPSNEDRTLTVAALVAMEPRISVTRLAELLDIPKAAAKTAKDVILQQAKRRKMSAAKQAVANDGKTVEEAATEHDVDVDALRREISGKKSSSDGLDVADTKRTLTRNAKSTSSARAAVYRSMAEGFEEGDLTAEQLREVMKHALDLAKKQQKSVSEANARLEEMIKARLAHTEG